MIKEKTILLIDIKKFRAREVLFSKNSFIIDIYNFDIYL